MTKTIEQMNTVSDAFATAMAEYPEKPALRSPDDSVVWTWSEYANQVAAASAGLHALGVRQGDTVALWLSNRPEFHVADMAVLPSHQRRGLGDSILAALLDLIRSAAPPGAYVNLLADPPGRRLYQRHGFAETAPGSVGMALILPPPE